MSAPIALFQRPFYFLRHGETESNARSLVAGSTETDLTPRGREQALRAAELLAREPITAIYSSPLRRAYDTARPVAACLKLEIVIVPELAERTWGVLEGQPRHARVRGVTPDGAETPEAFAQRIAVGLARIESPVPLIVAHSGIFRVLCHTLGIAEHEAPIANALPLRLATTEGVWKATPVV